MSKNRQPEPFESLFEGRKSSSSETQEFFAENLSRQEILVDPESPIHGHGFKVQTEFPTTFELFSQALACRDSDCKRKDGDINNVTLDGDIITDMAGYVRAVGVTIAQLLRESPSFLVDKPLSAFIDVKTVADFNRNLDSLADGRQNFVSSWLISLASTNGTVSSITYSVEVIHDFDGHKIGLCWHQQSQLVYEHPTAVSFEPELNLLSGDDKSIFAEIIESAPYAIVGVHTRNRIILFNKAAQQSFGYTDYQIIGQPLDTLFWANDDPDLNKLLRYAQESTTPVLSGSYPYALWGQHVNGSKFPLEATISNCLYPKQQFYTIILRDLSKQRKDEKEKDLLFREVSRQREQLRNLAQTVVLSGERERRRISRDLHDEAGQALTALKYYLVRMSSELSDKENDKHYSPDRVWQQLQGAIAMVETTMQQIRLVAHDLRPSTLDNVGISLTLQGFCREFAEQTGVSIDYVGNDVITLNGKIDITLYHCLQEALTNVIRHAEATQVWVSFHVDENEIILSIEDDGVGFAKDSATVGQKAGIGLLGIRERLESIQGNLEIQSGVNEGTLLVIRIPRN